MIPGSQSLSLIDEFIVALQGYLESYGWQVVFCALVLYLMRDYVRKGLDARSLAIANDPKRRKVLDSDLRRVRVKQQQNAPS